MDLFLKRRVSPDDLEEAFQVALRYGINITHRHNYTKKETRSKDKFVDVVLQLLMDEIHPKLLDINEDFPYDKILSYLDGLFRRRIEKKYISVF